MLIAPRFLWRHGTLLERMVVEVRSGIVTSIRSIDRDTPDAAPYLLMPACTDLQVNGGGGVMVNAIPTADGLREVAAAHRRLGSGGILPTVITDGPDVLEAAAEACIAACGRGGILGLHIEGPHIAAERRGTHDARYIRPLDRRTVDVVARLRAARIPVILTLAPEMADPALLEEMRATGAVLSAGHTAAGPEQIKRALAAGITSFTHLFNAMPPMTSRRPGVVGTAIVSDAFCGLIADGIHVSWDMLRIAIAARPRPDRCFVVSDAMATVGGPDSFSLYGQEIRVAGGALVNSEGSLAGAHIDMITSLANLHHHVGVPLDRAVAMATDIPRAVMRLPPLQVDDGTSLSDLITLQEDLTLGRFPAEGI